jgi:membrane protein required for colicin V production
MNWLDIILIIILIGSLIGGLISGLIKMAFSLAGLILGVVLAGRFYINLAEYLTFVPTEKGPPIVAFIIILLAVMIVAALLGVLFTKLVQTAMLGWLNRLGGAVLGLFLGAITLASILAIAGRYGDSISILSESVTAGVLLDKVPIILALLPSEFDSVRQWFQ